MRGGVCAEKAGHKLLKASTTPVVGMIGGNGDRYFEARSRDLFTASTPQDSPSPPCRHHLPDVIHFACRLHSHQRISSIRTLSAPTKMTVTKINS